MKWTMLTNTIIRHFCEKAGRIVSTVFFEERCPYCKAHPPERKPA